MANVIFKNLQLQNFMSYEYAELALNRKGNVQVGGINNNPEDSAKSNGCGKSTLFNALAWALTGETVSGASNVANIYTNGKTEVSVEFEFDGDEYKITRTKNPSNLFIYINGENKSGKGIRDTSKLLTEYIPQLDSNLITSVIILGQGLPQRFTNNTPSGRKDVLEKLSNSDFMIQDLKTRLSERKSTLEKQKRDLEDEILKNNTLIDSKKLTVSKLEGELDLMLEDVQLITAIEACKLENESCVLKSDECQKIYDDLITSENDKKDELSQARQDAYEAKEKLDLEDESVLNNKLIELSTEVSSISKEINKLENIKDVCPTCGQKIPGVHKIDTTELRKSYDDKNAEYMIVQQELTDLKSRNNQKLKECQEESERIIHEKSLELSEIQSALVKAQIELNEAKKNKDYYASQLIQLKSQLENAEKEREYKKHQIEDLTKELEVLKEKVYNNNEELVMVNSRIAIDNKMLQFIKRDFRGYLLNNIISYISERAKIYSLEVFGTDKLTFELSGNNIDIAYDGKDYSCLSGGEKQKLDVIIQFALRDMLCTFLNFSSNILVLDEITDALDTVGVTKIFNLISSHLQDVEALYIISHHTDELEIPADDEIIIIKGDDKISRII